MAVIDHPRSFSACTSTSSPCEYGDGSLQLVGLAPPILKGPTSFLMDLVAHRSSQGVGNFGDRLWGDSMILVNDARADDTGRVTPYDATLPVGEALVYQLEPTSQPSWSTGTTREQWQQQQGTVIRLAFDAVSAEFGSWRLTCELDVGNSGDRVVVDVV